MPRVTARGKRGNGKVNSDSKLLKFPHGNKINFDRKLTPRVSATAKIVGSAKYYPGYDLDEQYCEWTDSIGYTPIQDQSLTQTQALNHIWRKKEDRINLLNRRNPFLPKDDIKYESTVRDSRGRGTRKIIKPDTE